MERDGGIAGALEAPKATHIHKLFDPGKTHEK